MRLTAQPTATWVIATGDAAVQQVRAAVADAARRHAVPVVVLWRIPHRDCGSYSAGAQHVTAPAYRGWLHRIVPALGDRLALVVARPDALAQIDYLTVAQRDKRIGLVRDAVALLRAQGSRVYGDAGHAGWISVQIMAAALHRVGVNGDTDPP